MAIDDGKMLTFEDLQYLIDEEGFRKKNNFIISAQCCVKDEIADALYIDETATWIGWDATRLVPRRILVPGGVYWAGIAPVCVQDDGSGGPPVDNPPTAPTIVYQSRTTGTITFNWNANPGTDDGNIVGYTVQLARASSPGLWILEDYVTVTEHSFIRLDPSDTYIVRVKAWDDAQPTQGSPWSNELSITTLAPGASNLTLTSVDGGDLAGSVYGFIQGPIGDVVTMELTINAAGTTDPYDEWQYVHRSNTNDPSGSEETLVLSPDDSPSIPQTYQWQITMDGTEIEVLRGWSYRTPTNFYGWTEANLGVINTTGTTSLPSSVTVWIAGASSGH